jgi:hypothetical protein
MRESERERSEHEKVFKDGNGNGKESKRERE